MEGGITGPLLYGQPETSDGTASVFDVVPFSFGVRMTLDALPTQIGPYRNRILGLRVMPAGELADHPRNWRKHPPAQEQGLDAVMRQVGVLDVIRYNEPTNRIWDGHLRKKLFAADPQTPVIVLVTDLSEEEEAVALVTFDAITGLARADTEVLLALLRLARDAEVVAGDEDTLELLHLVAKQYGVSLDEARGGQDPGADLEHAAELREKWGTRRGQLWEIPSLTVAGKNHRLLCGDSTSLDDVTRLMDGQRAALFSTDPPYLVDYDATNHPHAWNKPDTNKDWSDSYHDWDDAAQGEGLYDGFVAAALEVAITQDAAWYCWHASRHQAMLEQVWENHGAFVHQQIIWVKDRPILTRSHYLWQHEPCLMGWLKGHKPYRVPDAEHCSTVWSFPTIAPGSHTDHPTSKPVELFAIPMRQHTRPGAVCYEPFAGSGSQFVAGEQLGRLVYGLELQPEFCAVILERLARMGLEPRLGEGV
jgi:DNA modification methylase